MPEEYKTTDGKIISKGKSIKSKTSEYADYYH